RGGRPKNRSAQLRGPASGDDQSRHRAIRRRARQDAGRRRGTGSHGESGAGGGVRAGDEVGAAGGPRPLRTPRDRGRKGEVDRGGCALSGGAVKLRTSRLILVPATPEQVRALIAGDYTRASELIGADVPVGWPHEADAIEGLPWHLSALERDASHHLWRIRFVIEAATHRLIGAVNLKGPPHEGDVEIGWGIIAESRRRGYATEASRAVIDWALENDAVRRVTATVPVENAASQAVARSLGMTQT